MNEFLIKNALLLFSIDILVCFLSFTFAMVLYFQGNCFNRKDMAVIVAFT